MVSPTSAVSVTYSGSKYWAENVKMHQKVLLTDQKVPLACLVQL